MDTGAAFRSLFNSKYLMELQVLPGGSAVKNLPAMREPQEMGGFGTWFRKLPWRRT